MKPATIALWVGVWVAILSGIQSARADIFFDSPHSSVPEEVVETEEVITITLEVDGTTVDISSVGHKPGFENIVMSHQDKCAVKAMFFEDIVTIRGSVETADAEREHILAMMADSWNAEGSSIPHHAHVDNQRVTRDAYRVQNGEYLVKDAGDYGLQVWASCMALGF